MKSRECGIRLSLPVPQAHVVRSTSGNTRIRWQLQPQQSSSSAAGLKLSYSSGALASAKEMRTWSPAAPVAQNHDSSLVACFGRSALASTSAVAMPCAPQQWEGLCVTPMGWRRAGAGLTNLS
eukprot:CAMPEP_0197923930 /NCGR_PEP_ID=MMETSP1439-20131203/94842_1 /TAXON_ID=66791 /ORGANISM="Gonyaulax spinifera, Strain CCMP409" /LENGTH=122 /DNA_ID=CAMNT_0043546325 /DNA_START=175 /DNA_END=540 /DNA_ORIENTATION=+